MADVAISIALAGLAGVQTDLSKLGGSFAKIDEQVKGASVSLAGMGEKMGALGGKISLLAAPAALLGASIIKSAADFERSMNIVQVTSGASAEQMKRAADISRQLGTDTTFSANQAADALNVLLRNGVSLTNALDGTLQATVKLAAATGTDLSSAADILSSQMAAYGIAAKDASKATDVLYNASIASKFGLTDFSTAMGYAERGGLALHIAFDDLSVGLASTSFAFSDASTAGTSMTDFLIRIQPQSKKAAEEMRNLGLITADGKNKFFDARGEFIGFGAAAELLKAKLGGLTAQQKLQAEETIFGVQGLQTVNALMIAGADAVDKNKAAIDKWGTTNAAAAKMMEGFWGAIDRLGGAISDVGNALLESGFIDALTWMINNLADLISWLAKMPPTLLNIAAALTAAAVAAGPLLLVLAGIATALGLLSAPLVAVTAGITALATAIVYFKDNILGAFHQAIANTYPVLSTLAGWLGVKIPDSLLTLGQHVAAVPADIQQQMASVKGDLTNPFAQAVAATKPIMDQLHGTVAGGAAKTHVAAAKSFDTLSNDIVRSMKDAVEGIKATDAPLEDQVAAMARLGQSLEAMGAKGTKAVQELKKELSDNIAAHAQVELKNITDDLTLSLDEQARQVTKLAQDYVKYGKLGGETEDDLLDKAQKLNDTVASSKMGKITGDQTKNLEEQRDSLRQLYFDYVDMGQGGSEAALHIAAKIEELNQDLHKHQNVIYGVTAALTENENQWGGWGDAAGGIVRQFSQMATDGLTTFFTTGKLQLDDFGASIIQVFAGAAADAVVSFVSTGIKSFIAWGTTMFEQMVVGSSGMDVATASATLLDFALSPILIVVLAIAAALGILMLAGVDIGDIFKFLANLVGGALKAAFDAFMQVVSAIAAVFSALNDILQAFVGWIGSIGKELGKGDLKDLLKIFSGGGIFDSIIGGIGDVFGGIFGGLFHEGGWVGGSGDTAILAKSGEFVVEPGAAARNAALLEAINSGSSMHEAIQMIAPGGEMIQVSRAGPGSGMAHGAGGGGGGDIHIHGSVISDNLGMSQVGRTLSRSIRAEDKRLRGRG